ncbi:GAF domain-containing protein [Ramlibacter sp. PS4R-6]|uniref:GAF domain-containing protein n=1 Tax=Ramlibacter sp. PS4R-6 TaxID=3133438 RepID=UPI00309F3082
MTLPLSHIRACLEGAIPAAMATCAPDGTPNVVYISQVFFVDDRHVALSFQFFNKTRRNVLAHPYATVLVLDPRTAAHWRLHLHYLRTETSGPLFEGMKAQLAGIASHTGMEDVFKLLGSDVYEVERVERVEGEALPPPPPRGGVLAAVRRCCTQLARSASMDDALNTVMGALRDGLAIEHAMVLMLDAASRRLYTVASMGYAHSGVGSEIELGQGVIGVAAREATPVRIVHVTHASLYTQAMRGGAGLEAATEIPYPGLAQPRSQLAVPIVSAAGVLGVLFAESGEDLRFDHEDEDALATIAAQFGAVIAQVQDDTDADTPAREAPPATAPAAPPLVVRHFASNASVFFGDDYLIKGVAGAILWKLLNEHARGRSEFSNRELRLDPAIGLPDVCDNLEARLVLLRRRLEEYGDAVRIEKTGRGRFRLAVTRPVTLHQA